MLTLAATALLAGLLAGPAQTTSTQDVVAPPATDAPAAASTTAPAASEEEAEPRMVCRNETLVGTRFPTRVCMRVEEREQRTRESRDLARRLDVQNSNRGRIYAPTSGAPQ